MPPGPVIFKPCPQSRHGAASCAVGPWLPRLSWAPGLLHPTCAVLSPPPLWRSRRPVQATVVFWADWVVAPPPSARFLCVILIWILPESGTIFEVSSRWGWAWGLLVADRLMWAPSPTVDGDPAEHIVCPLDWGGPRLLVPTWSL